MSQAQIFKAGTILWGEKDGKKVVYLAKTSHPSTRENPNQNVKYQFMVTLSAGKFDPKTERSRIGALRELCEETGGYFVSDFATNPWSDDKAILEQQHSLCPQDLQKLEKMPIVVNMFWKTPLEANYTFYTLKVRPERIIKINKFCQQAREKLPENLNVFKEIDQYLTVPLEEFISKLEKMSQFTPSSHWFSCDDANENEPEGALYFTNSATGESYPFNKGYFMGLSQVVNQLKYL